MSVLCDFKNLFIVGWIEKGKMFHGNPPAMESAKYLAFILATFYS